MAAPNIVNVSTITGKTAVQAVSTSATAIVTNSAASGKVYKVNSLLVSNVDGINTAEVTIDLYRSSTAYHLIKTASITAGSTLDLLAKTIYLEEGDSIRLTGSALSDLEAVCSYEEIDSTGSGSAGIFSSLTATGNTDLGDAEATDTHAIKGATTLLANTSSDALRITQTGSGNALVVEDSANPGSTPFVVDANGRVGIGTTSPDGKLHIDGVTSSVSGLVIESNENADCRFIDFQNTSGLKRIGISYDNALVTLNITDRDNNKLVTVEEATGNVGIGTSPDTKLNVVQSSTGRSWSPLGGQSDLLVERNGNSGVSIVAANSSSSVLNFGDTDDENAGFIAYYHFDDAMVFRTGGSGEDMRIDSSGRVGIGTSFPVTDLTVNSSITTKNSGGYYGGQAYYSDGAWRNAISGQGGFAIRNNTGVFSVFTGASTSAAGTAFADFSEKLRIDSSGNVGIGTGSSISYQLELSTDSAGKPSTNTWTIVSDERIKENIELADLDLCYDAVKNIPLKRFKWRDDVYSEEQVADRHKLGWIAQDVETVYPKAVNIHEFKYNQVYNDVVIPATENEPERTEKELVSEDVIEDCRNLNADQIYAAMYGAIQKLIQKVETLETRIAKLEA